MKLPSRDLSHKGGAVGGLEEGGAGHEGVGAGGAAFGAGLGVDSAVDFEAELEAGLAAPGVELGDLGQHVAAEGLSAEAGLHGHDEKEIDLGEEGLGEFGRRAGVEHEAGLATELADAGEQCAVIDGGLEVEADEVGAGFGEGLHEVLGVVQHEVDVEKEAGHLAAELGDHLRAEGEVGHEVAVHDVQVQPRRAGGRDLRGALGQAGVLAGENGGGEKGGMDGSGHGQRPWRNGAGEGKGANRESVPAPE